MLLACPEVNLSLATITLTYWRLLKPRSPQLLTEFFHFFKERCSKSPSLFFDQPNKTASNFHNQNYTYGGSSNREFMLGRTDHMNS